MLSLLAFWTGNIEGSLLLLFSMKTVPFLQLEMRKEGAMSLICGSNIARWKTKICGWHFIKHREGGLNVVILSEPLLTKIYPLQWLWLFRQHQVPVFRRKSCFCDTLYWISGFNFVQCVYLGLDWWVCFVLWESWTKTKAVYVKAELLSLCSHSVCVFTASAAPIQ